MIIRRMTELDLEQVWSIEKENFTCPWSKGSFLNSLLDENHIYLVAESQGSILGYCGMWNILGEGNITNVAVKKSYWNQKIGKQLMVKLLELGEENGVLDVTLEVRVNNTSAIHLYSSLGFKNVGIRKNFYEKPVEDAIIMWYHKED